MVWHRLIQCRRKGGSIPASVRNSRNHNAAGLSTRILTNSRNVIHSVRVLSTTDYTDRLRLAGLRVTRSRAAVLEAVHAHPHSGTDTILDAVRVVLPGVSRQAVYGVLHVLTARGLVRRIQPAGLVARYESRVGDNHHHDVCRSCGAIADVDCTIGETPCLAASHDNGYTVDEAEIFFWGLCLNCSTSQQRT